ncbi:hypothetical protein BP6252_10137 [Coleophoma cylindrospora]|uniref:RRM domain-containing protein n=1 Tax=Coleophoma cylindrospora TaxID=1849047 RepID=A0A3D8QXH8_9HELO|nr:hypothetical protein BP6252_10137 [Coleophoma cylindrospora]
MSASTVHVKNISAQTGEKEVKDFFSFCGKITDLKITSAGETQDATVTFEKETAAKTALLLDNTQLGSTHVKVTSATGDNEDDGSHFTTNAERDSDDITQEEKPRSRIIAEYLAHGYVIGDTAAQRAIDLDSKHGISTRFLNTLKNIDAKYHPTDKAKAVDQSYGVTAKASNLLTGLTSYYEKAAGTPTGQKLVNFYTQTSRQVQDIHTEARRLADLKKQESSSCKCGSNSEKCDCAPGSCSCSSCANSDVKTIPGTNRTVCKCGGAEKECPCPAGQCACGGCSKSDVKPVAGSEKTTCGCGGNTKVCGCMPGKCSCGSCPKASMKVDTATGKTTCNCAGSMESCPCEPGKCACGGCAKASMKVDSSTGKTTCGCGGSTASCPCEPGKCSCGDCAKSSMQVEHTGKTTCACGGSTKDCPCAPGKCACNNCAKAETEAVPGTDKTKCKCGGNDKTCASTSAPSATDSVAATAETAKVAPLEKTTFA